MTEQEWLGCTDPQPMLEFIQGKVSERKLRLFTCACCRWIWPELRDARSRRAVEIGELFADGASDYAALTAALEDAGRVLTEIQRLVRHHPERNWSVVGPPTICARLPAWPTQDSHVGKALIEATLRVKPGQELQLVRTVHCIFGPLPFRPVDSDPSWRTPTVMALAQAIYDDRAFDRLPILADALGEVGCSNADVLSHCRQPDVHARGCWVVDLLTEKE